MRSSFARLWRAGRGIIPRLLLVLGLGCAGPVLADDLPVIRAAVLKIGTVNWELQTILREGLDRAHGFRLEVQPYADTAATHLAVQGGAADLAVADMIWLARPLDKSWLILRAYARAQHGMDLEAETQQVFGAPPLIYKSALRADYAGAINYWHFLARMKAEGMRELISVGTAAEALGLDPATPLLGYYMREGMLAEHPVLAQAFYETSRAAKDVLGRSEAAWEALRPLIAPQSEAQFAQLREGWLAGVPPRGPVDPAGAQTMFALMHELGGRDLVGDAARLPPGLFAKIE